STNVLSKSGARARTRTEDRGSADSTVSCQEPGGLGGEGNCAAASVTGQNVNRNDSENTSPPGPAATKRPRSVEPAGIPAKYSLAAQSISGPCEAWRKSAAISFQLPPPLGSYWKRTGPVSGKVDPSAKIVTIASRTWTLEAEIGGRLICFG